MNDIILFDYDMFGRLNSRNEIETYYNEDSLKNSLRIWFTSREGDRLRSPGTGGFLDFQVDKLMSDDNLSNFSQRILRALEEDFRGYFVVQELKLTKNANRRLLDIYLRVLSKRLNTNFELNLKIRTQGLI